MAEGEAIFVGHSGPIRGHAPRGHKLVTVEHTNRDVAVTDVQGEKHWRLRYTAARPLASDADYTTAPDADPVASNVLDDILERDQNVEWRLYQVIHFRSVRTPEGLG